jgi:hypothetical protein
MPRYLWFALMRLYPGDGVALFVAVNAGAPDRVRPLAEAAADAALTEARARGGD